MTAKTYKETIFEEELKNDPALPAWFSGLRQAAFERFRETGFPNRKDEFWRNTAVDRILNGAYQTGNQPLELTVDHLFDKYNLVKEGERRAVTINGIYAPEYSLEKSLPTGVIFENLYDAVSKHPDRVKSFLTQSVQSEGNAFSLINGFRFQDGVFIDVPGGQTVDIPIHLVLAGFGNEKTPPVFYPRILVRLGKDAKLNLVTSFVSLNREPHFTDSVTEVYLDEGSKLNWTIVQRQTARSSKVSTNKCYLKANSSLERSVFVRGGDVSHSELDVYFEGAGASCFLSGLSLLAKKSQSSQIIRAHHQASQCTSRQLYKNILAEDSQAEFNSLVHVCHGTKGSDSNQLNRNLILSNKARAFSRPQLKIDADDVIASHGSATGQLEDRELFYLRSRGFDLKTAKFVLTYGFAEEILEKIKPDSARWQLELLVRKEIEAMVSRY